MPKKTTKIGCRHSFSGHTGPVNSIRFHKTSLDTFVLTSSDDNTARIWKEDASVVREFTGHTSRVIDCQSWKDRLFSASNDSTIRCFDIETGSHLMSITNHVGKVTGMNISKDLVFSTSLDHTLKVFDPSTGLNVQQMNTHTDIITQILVAENSWNCYTSSCDGTIAHYDIRTGKLLHHLKGHESWIWSMGLLENENILFSGSKDNTIRSWNTVTGLPIQVLKGHTYPVYRIIVDKGVIYSSSWDNTIGIWSSTIGTRVHTINPSLKRIHTIAIDPLSEYIIASGVEPEINVFSTITGDHVLEFAGHSAEVTSLRFDPDSSILYSASKDNTLRSWDFPVHIETSKQSSLKKAKTLSRKAVSHVKHVHHEDPNTQSRFPEVQSLLNSIPKWQGALEELSTLTSGLDTIQAQIPRQLSSLSNTLASLSISEATSFQNGVLGPNAANSARQGTLQAIRSSMLTLDAAAIPGATTVAEETRISTDAHILSQEALDSLSENAELVSSLDWALGTFGRLDILDHPTIHNQDPSSAPSVFDAIPTPKVMLPMVPLLLAQTANAQSSLAKIYVDHESTMSAHLKSSIQEILDSIPESSKLSEDAVSKHVLHDEALDTFLLQASKFEHGKEKKKKQEGIKLVITQQEYANALKDYSNAEKLAIKNLLKLEHQKNKSVVDLCCHIIESQMDLHQKASAILSNLLPALASARSFLQAQEQEQLEELASYPSSSSQSPDVETPTLLDTTLRRHFRRMEIGDTKVPLESNEKAIFYHN